MGLATRASGDPSLLGQITQSNGSPPTGQPVSRRQNHLQRVLEEAQRFREAVGVKQWPSAIVSAVADDAVPELMESARIVGSVRAGRLRLSFHLSTSEADAERAADVLRGHLRD